MHEARLDYSFDILHVQIIFKAMKLLWKWSKMLVLAGNLFRKRWQGN